MPEARKSSSFDHWSQHAPGAVRDLRGGVRLAFDGVQRALDGIEAMQQRMAEVQPPPRGTRVRDPGQGAAAYLYRGVRGAADLVGGGVDLTLASIQASLQSPQRQREPAADQPLRDHAVAALNAALGDHLHRTDNPLAVATRLRPRGAVALPRVLVLVHGLGLGDLQWRQQGHDHGQALGAALGCTPVYALYNSGRHVAATGRELATELEMLVAHRRVPVEGVALLGHGLGGLVVHSAVQQALRAGMAWPALLQKTVLLGTPHHGAELPRGARHFLPGAPGLPTALARLSGHTSEGMADFVRGMALPHEGRASPAHAPELQPAVPLPAAAPCYAVAGAVGDGSSDGLVPVTSALGRHPVASRDLQLPEDRRWIAHGVDHMGLLGSEAVFQKMRHWLAW